MQITTTTNEGKEKLIRAYLPLERDVRGALSTNGSTASPEQLETILWFLDYGRTENIGSISALARKISVDPATLSKIFSGKYGADISGMVDRMADLRLRERGRAADGHVLVPDLRVAREITKFCQLTYKVGTLGVLFGPNQSGKTWTLKKIFAPAHPHVVYIDMLPSGGSAKMFAEDLVHALGGSRRQSYNDLKRHIYRKLTPRHLVVIDEFHQTLIGRSVKMATVELVKGIFEACGCAMVLSGTDIIPEMFRDKSFNKFLGQINNRAPLKRMIPAQPYPEDVLALCKAYGLGAPTGEAKKQVDWIALNHGIGLLCKTFILATILVREGETLSWEHFLDWRATSESWEKGDRMIRSTGVSPVGKAGVSPAREAK